MTAYKTIAESKNFIVLDKYTKEWQISESYQSEADLERELIKDLVNQGYEYEPDLSTPESMLANIRNQLEALNKVAKENGYSYVIDTANNGQVKLFAYLDDSKDLSAKVKAALGI